MNTRVCLKYFVNDCSSKISTLSESAKLRAVRARNALTPQRAPRAYAPTCQRAPRAYGPTRQRALHAHALTCQRALRAHALKLQCTLHAGQRALGAYALT